MTSTSAPQKTLRNLRRGIVVYLLLIVAIAAVFWQLPRHDFVNLDDDIYVTENPHVRAGLTRESITWSFGFTDSPYWHPLTWFSHMLDCQLFGLKPGMHHLTNLIFHLANSLLLLFILNRMTGSLWKSSFVAALFALHPLNVESVAWVASRKNVLSTFFWLFTMLSYVYYSERPSVHRYLFTCLLFVLGLMAKPMLVTLPFVLLLLDYWPLGRFSFGQLGDYGNAKDATSTVTVPAKKTSAPLVLEKIPLLIFSMFSIYVTSLAVQLSGIVISTDAVPMKLRIANGLVSYVGYMAKMVWPNDLAVYYPYPGTLPMWQIVGAGGVLLFVSILIVRARRKAPYLVTGWLWYLGTLIPVIGLKQVGLWPAMADRFAYVPLIGLFIMIAWGVPHLVATLPYGRIFLASAAGAVLTVWMLLTWTQLNYWKNSVTLFEHALKVTSNNDVAHNNLGNVLARQGKVKEAIGHYVKALQIKPDFPRAHNNLGNALARQGNDQEAIDHYTKALQLKPDFAGAHNNLGNVLEHQGRIHEALYHYSMAIELKQDFADAYFNLGTLLARQGESKEAMAHFSKALQFKPEFAEAHNSLGTLLARQGKLSEAIDHFREALRIRPDFRKAQRNLQIALQESEQSGQGSKNGDQP